MESIECEFAEFFKNTGKSYGFDDLRVSIIAVLYLEPEEISMDEIAKRTGYSLPSISNTMKTMENALCITRIRKPKTKKVFFYMDKDLSKLHIIKLELLRQTFINPVKEKMPEIIFRFKTKAKTEKDAKKLKIIENHYKQIVAFDKIIINLKKELEKITLENLSKKRKIK